jgi:hypothetical protein
MKIKLTKKQCLILDFIFTAVYLGLAFWADWRIGLAFVAYDISCVLETLRTGTERRRGADVLKEDER